MGGSLSVESRVGRGAREERGSLSRSVQRWASDLVPSSCVFRPLRGMPGRPCRARPAACRLWSGHAGLDGERGAGARGARGRGSYRRLRTRVMLCCCLPLACFSLVVPSSQVRQDDRPLTQGLPRRLQVRRSVASRLGSTSSQEHRSNLGANPRAPSQTLPTPQQSRRQTVSVTGPNE